MNRRGFARRLAAALGALAAAPVAALQRCGMASAVRPARVRSTDVVVVGDLHDEWCGREYSARMVGRPRDGILTGNTVE